jgi:acyl-CoA thioester hydrolase
VSALFVTGRGAINAWECDQWGHLNVQFYLAKASDAQAVHAARLGLVPSRLRGTGPCLMPVADRTLFKRELRAGDIYAIRTGIRAAAAGGTLDIASRMFNQDTGVESAAFETRLRWMAPDRHTALPWPDDVLAAAVALAGELPEAPPPPPMAQTAASAPDLGSLALTYRGSVETWECGADGIAPPRAHNARITDAKTPLLRGLKIDRACLFQRGFGSAALDYDIAYLRPMRAGQCVDIRSGLLAAGEKIFHVVHYVVDSVSGEIITSIVVTALFFDLTARKSVAIRQALAGGVGSPLAVMAAQRGGAA